MVRCSYLSIVCLAWLATGTLWAQHAVTWAEIRDKFEMANPTLQAARIGIDESRTQEITAYLRPNPDFTVSVDQIDLFSTQPSPSGGGNSYSPSAFAFPTVSASYLHERQHKRGLRRESAQKATVVAESQLDDQRRTLLFTLRSAFVQVLQQKADLTLARDNLSYYDQLLKVSRDRKQAGDIAQVDLDRLELQRVQYESDLQNALVNLRTAKIQLLALLNDRTPLEQFDVDGPFEFSESIMPLDEFRRLALDSRPDLRAAVQSVDKARTDHQLATSNGST